MKVIAGTATDHRQAVRMLECIEDIVCIGAANNALAVAVRIPATRGKSEAEYVLNRLKALEEQLIVHGECIRNAWPVFSAAQPSQWVKLGNTRAGSMYLAVVKLAQELEATTRVWAAIALVESRIDDAKPNDAKLRK
jgi:hypothetical protein